MEYALQGLSMGLAYVAPIGMQNLFVIHTAMDRNAAQAWLTTFFVTGFDISLALACYAGAGLLLRRFPLLEPVLMLTGGALVFVIGLRLLRAPQADAARPDGAATPWRAFATAFAVAWLNPQAVLDGTMMLGAFRAALPPEGGTAFLGGVCLASCLWFCALTLTARLGRHLLTAEVLLWVNRVCAAVLMLYAARLVWTGALWFFA